MTISAKIVADSISPAGGRLVTMELCYPRFIHSEFLTHRMFSRNASSSRAIPVEKMLQQVQENPAMPVHWGKNQPGMQAREEIFPNTGKDLWKIYAKQTAKNAEELNLIGYHKQVVNRLLEPFQYIKVIVTATEWDNFFKLRLHEDAQPEIALLASKMREAMDGSTPNVLELGEWHLPYVSPDEGISHHIAVKCSVARCARVSYLNHDSSTPNWEKDVILYTKLLESGHFSPFEHQATPMEFPTAELDEDTSNFSIVGYTHLDCNGDYWSGNFKSWIQYRQLIGQI